MKLVAQMIIAVLIALFIKDRVDVYLIEHQVKTNFSSFRQALYDYLVHRETPMATEPNAIIAGQKVPDPQQPSVTPASEEKARAWRIWYAAVAPEKCLNTELKEDFVACTNSRIQARRAFEADWGERTRRE